MLANGWTLFDTISDAAGNRNQVFESTPIDAVANNPVYVKIASTTSYLVDMYTEWDAATHTGAKRATTNLGIGLGLAHSYDIRVNPYSFVIWANIVAFPPGLGGLQYAGFVRRGLTKEVSGLTRTTQAYSSGATIVNVASDMTSLMKPGQKVVIYNHSNNSASANFGRAGLLTVKTITSGTLEFTTSLGGGYDSGAVIGWNPFPSCNGFMNCQGPFTTFYSNLSLAAGYTGIQGQTVTGGPATAFPNTYPHTLGEITGGPIPMSASVFAATGFFGYLYHLLGVSSTSQTGLRKGELVKDGNRTYKMFSTKAAPSHGILYGPL
jgi:hypothetical protein